MCVFLVVFCACLVKVRQAVADAKQELERSNSGPAGGSPARDNNDDGVGFSGFLSLVRRKGCKGSLSDGLRTQPAQPCERRCYHPTRRCACKSAKAMIAKYHDLDSSETDGVG